MRGRPTIRGIGLLVTGVVSFAIAGLILLNSAMVVTPPGLGRFALALFFVVLGFVSLIIARAEYHSTAR